MAVERQRSGGAIDASDPLTISLAGPTLPAPPTEPPDEERSAEDNLPQGLRAAALPYRNGRTGRDAGRRDDADQEPARRSGGRAESGAAGARRRRSGARLDPAGRQDPA